MEFDEELENLFKCPAKFIVTTRMDFRDYNYKQITIDRMSDIKDLRELFYHIMILNIMRGKLII